MSMARLHTGVVFFLAASFAGPAPAKEKCTSMCHFYEAWALSKLCPKLVLNADAIREDKADSNDNAFSKIHDRLKRQVLGDMKANRDACDIDCKWKAEAPDPEELEGTPCQYLRLKQPL